MADSPRLFDDAVAALQAMHWRPELVIEEIPAPQRIAPHAVAVAAEVVSGGEDLGNGRLVLLHDPAGNPSWDGDFRCVTYARAEVEIRASWTPLVTSAEDITRHLMSWSELLCTTAGLPPLPEGVVVMSARRRR